MNPPRPSLAALALAHLLAASPAAAQEPPALEPASSGGVERLDRALAELSTHRRLLVVAAHPDDEDTSLLTLVSLGLGGEAAYLSLSRGDGGQNLIGPQLGEGLGLLRSRELLAAREVDGARQFFTRAYDFGYTRSLAETFERWPEEILLEDAVRVVRRFRPQVVVAVFPPTPRAGHGQHQASAVVAERAFEAAGDSAALPQLGEEGLAPARPAAFYRAGWFDRDSAALELPLGGIDPHTGKSTLQLALASRSRHRSQDMGSLQPLGSRNGRLIPVAGAARLGGSDPFAGIDTRLAALAADLAEGSRRSVIEDILRRVEALAVDTRKNLAPMRLGEAAGPLVRILGDLLSARSQLDGASPASAEAAVAALLEEKIGVAEEALATALGVVADAATDRAALVPGEVFEVEAALWNGGGTPVRLEGVDLRVAGGFVVEEKGLGESGAGAPVEGDFGAAVAPGVLRERRFTVSVPTSAPPSVPYFLENPRRGDLYDWSAVPPALRGEPFGPPVAVARFHLSSGGVPFTLEREVVHRFADQAVGEVRRPLQVLPILDLEVSPRLVVWPSNEAGSRRVEVRLANHGAHALSGRLVVHPPPGWPPVEGPAFEVAGHGRQVLALDLPVPESLQAGSHLLRLEAVTAAGERFGGGVEAIDYPHVRPTLLPRRAEVTMAAGDIRLPALGRVGYVRGASDRVPEALLAVGLPLELLSAEALAVGDLSGFDALVIGSRAYETDPALAEANGRLLDYVREGGHLVVQYQQYAFVRGGYAPLPLEIARPHDRVTDETAPVTLLVPDHPALTVPNRISPVDWQGWVQERGLYFAHTWDAGYEPLLEMADPEGPELRGGLLVARVGRGSYVYTGLAFFRQLPAGVVGAYRLFMNLLAPLPPATPAS